MTSPTEISAKKLIKLIGTPDCPTLIDVRIDEDFEQYPAIIPGAVRQPFDKILDFVERDGGPFIIYCHKGFKISQGAAALLRAKGLVAETLEGGFVGWNDAHLPTVAMTKRPDPAQDGASLWVTRHRPKIDRIAVPWLVRRFIDPSAKFLFVSPSEVLNVAEKFGAAPFDIDGVFWGHRGEGCTFDTFLEEFELHTDALKRMALVIRGADTNKHDLAPESAGLLAFSTGLSRMFRDDVAQMDVGMLFYDALYRWARDAFEEQHNE